MVKRLTRNGRLAAVGAPSSLVANREATVVWRRAFDEDRPE